MKTINTFFLFTLITFAHLNTWTMEEPISHLKCETTTENGHVCVINESSHPLRLYSALSSVLATTHYANYLNFKLCCYRDKEPGIDRQIFNQKQPLHTKESCQFPIPQSCSTPDNLSYLRLYANYTDSSYTREAYLPLVAQGAIIRLAEQNGILGFLRTLRLRNNLSYAIQMLINKCSVSEYRRSTEQEYIGPRFIQRLATFDCDLFIPCTATQEYFFPEFGKRNENPLLAGIRVWDSQQSTLTRDNSFFAFAITLSDLFPLNGDCSEFTIDSTQDCDIDLCKLQ